MLHNTRLFEALDRTFLEEEKPEADDNARTIRPTRSPSLNGGVLPRSASSPMTAIVEDYSDLAGEEEEIHLQAKVADFKVSAITTISLLSLIQPR